MHILKESHPQNSLSSQWRIVLFSSAAVVAIVVIAVLYFYKSGETDKLKDTNGSTIDASQRDAHIPSPSNRPWNEIDDPKADGWDTEVFAANAKKQLEKLGLLLIQFDSSQSDSIETKVAKLITDDFACESLLPSDLTTVLDDQHLKITRPSTVTIGKLSSKNVSLHHGVDGFGAALRAAAAPLSGATELRFEVKVFRVAKSQGGVSTRQYFSITGRTKSGVIEQHSTWDIRWKIGDKIASPRMQSLHVEEFEQAESRQASGALFADCTKSVLAGNPIYEDQFLRGMNHWFERIQDRSEDAMRGNPGVAIGDVNGDGLDDLYVCQETGLPNRLFIQNPDGSASEQSAAWGVDWLQSSRSALLVDLDNDSDQDLVVAILGGVIVAENDGDGKFQLRKVLKTSDDAMSLSAVDYDMDGRLDIFICLYYADKKLGSPKSSGLAGAAAGFEIHDANDGGENVLFRNEISADGFWRFVDVTGQVGLDVNNHRYSLAASWDDIDNDGDQDLYVANDFGRDHLYRNDLVLPSALEAGKGPMRQFVDISDDAYIEDSATGMSITWSDYDRDGWMDAFVSNMWSSAGQRIAYQEQFRVKASPDVKRRIQRLTRGNTLLRNDGNGTFADRSVLAGIEVGRWAWGSQFVDLNNDGWDDLIVANGYITTEDTGDL
jgi:hypothetical protein